MIDRAEDALKGMAGGEFLGLVDVAEAVGRDDGRGLDADADGETGGVAAGAVDGPEIAGVVEDDLGLGERGALQEMRMRGRGGKGEGSGGEEAEEERNWAQGGGLRKSGMG